MLAQQRRDRLLAEMQKAGIDAIIAFGTNWQEAYLRYVSDFCILEGSGVAVLTADGRCRLMLDSITEAERAQEEAKSVEVTFARELSRAVTPSLEPF
ncbi:MAG: aminopeptidase P family N-terminal domain-containing protein, partial [Xanthobacteraceae bacterium]